MPKTVKEAYDDYMSWCRENNDTTMSFEDYLWKICK